jgi:chemotaxis protein MotA
MTEQTLDSAIRTSAGRQAGNAARRADHGASIGLAAALAILVIAILLGDTPQAFFDIRSALIVFGGTAAVTAIAVPFADLAAIPSALARAFGMRQTNAAETVRQMLRAAARARRDGAKGLEAQAAGFRRDRFLKEAMTLVLDNHPPEEIESLLATRIAELRTREIQAAAVFRRAAEIAPAMGLIGTLIGLVQMLGALDRPEAIGPAMALALLTTLYGVLIGTVMLAPVAAKLERLSLDAHRIRAIVATAALSICRQESQHKLETRLNALLAPHGAGASA